MSDGEKNAEKNYETENCIVLSGSDGDLAIPNSHSASKGINPSQPKTYIQIYRQQLTLGPISVRTQGGFEKTTKVRSIMRGGKANKKKKKHRRRRKMIVRKRVYSANTTTVATIINEGMHKNWKPNQNGSKRTTSRRYKDSNNDTHMLLAAVAVVKNKNMFGDTPRTQPHLRSKI